MGVNRWNKQLELVLWIRRETLEGAVSLFFNICIFFSLNDENIM